MGPPAAEAASGADVERVEAPTHHYETSMSHAIELTDVSWRAGRDFHLRDLSLRVPTGAIYGFLGPNGSGKTTTIRIFMGMVRPDTGTIRVLGGGVPEEAPRILARVGYVPERPHRRCPDRS